MNKFDEYWSCSRKVKYGHWDTAKRAIVAMRAKGVLNLSAYVCRYCDGFHIGHNPSLDWVWEWLPGGA